MKAEKFAWLLVAVFLTLTAALTVVTALAFYYHPEFFIAGYNR